MATSNSTPAMETTTSSPPPLQSMEDVAVKALTKRFEGLVTVRTKAIKGKGAWYWTHLEPVLIRTPDTDLPKAVKLRCTLCDSAFSASNPSRTASEHLKRGTCPNFSSVFKPISQKRSFPDTSAAESTRGTRTESSPQRLVLSGGKEDLGALALLENSVKKLKSPKSSPCPSLTKDQVDSALEFLADWFYESCGSVSLLSLEHPKFRAFLTQVGLPRVSGREFSGARLDSKFDEVKTESEARVREAAFFQLSSDGWKGENCGNGEENLIKFMVNLPNGTSVFRKAVFTAGSVPSEYAEEILWETVEGLCGSVVHRCVGVVADKYKAKALRNLEIRNHWMVNLSCQFEGVVSLIKDFSKELPLFKTVTDNCLKVASYFNSKSLTRHCLRKFRLQEVEHDGFLRVPSPKYANSNDFTPIFAMLEDVLNCARVIQLAVSDDTYKVVCAEDPFAREVAEMIRDSRFWNNLGAVYSLVKLIRDMGKEIEVERPLASQCLPLWEDVRVKVKDWCVKFNISEDQVERIVDKRFKKNYHPAWSAAFILDPQYLIRDSSGKYVPPFKFLTHEQENDVDKLITRLVSRDEAHVALMELMKWRSEGLEPLYAQAVQVKQRDPVSGKMRNANPQSSRLVWETCLKEFKSLGKVATRLLFLHATACGFKSKGSFMRWLCVKDHSRVCLERAQKMIFIAAHAKLERGDFSSEEEKDAELFSAASGEDDMLNGVFADASSIQDSSGRVEKQRELNRVFLLEKGGKKNRLSKQITR